MRGQVPVEAAIGDSFPATALSLLPRKGASEVDGQAYGRQEIICKQDSQSAANMQPFITPLSNPHFIMLPNFLQPPYVLAAPPSCTLSAPLTLL